ncbi:TPA: glycosyltransferase family 4 protein, partial [Klebsiella pneumoniae]|nr:glycosyltransferase family 4 protein [Klebsiella pneumoniae]
MSIGIVADWLVTYAGAERVIKEVIDLYPESEVYSVIDFLSDTHRGYFNGKHATTTFIQKLPFSEKIYQKYLPFMPLAIEQLNVSAHDIVISSSHAVAKGILTGPDQLHISYVHSPIRYAWDLQHQYLREAHLDKGLKGLLT